MVFHLLTKNYNMNYLKKLQEFNYIFNVQFNDSPGLRSVESGEFMAFLIEEELEELKESIRKNDFRGIIDALCDLQYVLSGTVLHYGLYEIFNDCFKEVHRSNISKVCKNKKDAQRSVDAYKEKGIPTFIEETNGLFLIKRKSDKKILKGINFKEPNFGDIILKQK